MDLDSPVYELRLDRISLHRFKLKFREPISMGGQTHLGREGLLLGIRIGPHFSMAECSPLPGFSEENIDDVQRAVVEWAESLRLHPKVLRVNDRGDLLNEDLRPLPPYPSLHFGLSTAFTGLQKQIRGLGLAGLWGKEAQKQVEINALITGDPLSWLSQGREFMTREYRCLKVKVGRNQLDGEIAGLQSLGTRLRNDVRIRLDANRAWSLDEATSFCKAVENLNIEYIEEPLRNPAELAELHNRTEVPFALDETLQIAFRPDAVVEIPQSGVVAWIVKPTLLGDLTVLSSMAEMAEKHGVHLVFTSTFESDIGLRSILELSSVLAPRTSCGAGTIEFFESGLTSDAKLFIRPIVNIGDFAIEPVPDAALASKVYSW